jgi:hypothetical protein
MHYYFYGNSLRDQILPEQQKHKGIIEEFKKAGFITGYTADECQQLSLFFDEDQTYMYKSLRRDHE